MEEWWERQRGPNLAGARCTQALSSAFPEKQSIDQI